MTYTLSLILDQNPPANNTTFIIFIYYQLIARCDAQWAMYYVLCLMSCSASNVLCFMYYVWCVMCYVLCVMCNGWCVISQYILTISSSSLSHDAMLNEQCVMCYVWSTTSHYIITLITRYAIWVQSYNKLIKYANICSKNLIMFAYLKVFVLSNSKCNFVCKVSKNILKNKIKECQNAIFLLVSCLICIVFF